MKLKISNLVGLVLTILVAIMLYSLTAPISDFIFYILLALFIVSGVSFIRKLLIEAMIEKREMKKVFARSRERIESGNKILNRRHQL
jgi:hypothetical protein